MRSKGFFVSLFLLMFVVGNSYSTTYYTTGSGNWTGAFWSSTCTTCAGSALPTLFAGDILEIDDQITIASGTITITPGVIINLRTNSATVAKLIFASGGKLTLTSASSVLNLINDNPSLFSNPIIDGTGSGGSNTIKIGGNEVWRASNGDVVGVGQLNTGSSGGVLPIFLRFFQATLVGETIHLDWSTLSEENFEKFIIERSSTGTNFLPIGEVPGAGRDIFEIETKYTIIDESPLLGYNYYRLKAVDLDGQFEYFDVRVIKLTGPKQLSIYPNPSSGKSISFVLNFNPSENDQAVLVNSLGVELLRASVTGIENQLNFDNGLSPGVYVLKYLSTDFETSARVVVSH